jgi:hypothetical protein
MGVKKEGKKVNTLLKIESQVENIVSPKKSHNKKNVLPLKIKEEELSGDEMKKLYELQQRQSSSDEFPLLWGKEDK